MKFKPTALIILITLVWAACSSGGKKEQAENGEEKKIIEEGTSTDEAISGEELSYSAEGDSVELHGYLAYDKSIEDKRPGILVVHEWWGHNEYARERADLLAELGYVALAVDMYGEGKQASHPDDAGKFAGMVMQNAEGAKERFAAAMEKLKSNPNVDPEKIGAIGYCFGGSVALSMANAGMDLDAVAVFHAGLKLPIQPEQGEVKAKILVCNGADDNFIAPEDIENFKNSMEEANVDYEFVSYEGAVHSFTSPDADSLGTQFELPLAYNKEADEDSWNKMQELFALVF
ncbi:MAG: dienelactone hydrolase family protein [Bacteroidota bacterium]